MLQIIENAKIATKLMTITAIAVFLFSALAWAAIYSLYLNQTSLNTVNTVMHQVAVATAAQIGTKEIGVSVRNIFRSTTKEEANKAAEKSLHYLTHVDENLSALQQLNVQYTDVITNIRTLWKQYAELTKDSINKALAQIEERSHFFTLGPPLSSSMNKLVDAAELDVTNSGVATAKLVHKAESAISQRRIAIWRYLAVYEPKQIEIFHKQIELFNTALQEITHSDLAVPVKAQLPLLQQRSDEYNKSAEAVIQLSKEYNDIYFNTATQMRAKAGDILDKLVTTINNEEQQLIDKTMATTQFATNGIMIFGIILVILLFGSMTYIGRMISHPITSLYGMMEQLANGNLSIQVEYTQRRDEIGLMSHAVASMVTTLKTLMHELQALIGEAKAGNLSARGDASQLKGEYTEVLEGTNELLNVLSQPLTELVQVMQRLAAGDLKGRMTGSYTGQLQALKINVNRSLDSLVALLAELVTLAEGMAIGDLRRNLNREYQGDFATLKLNFNQALTTLRNTVSAIGADTTQVSSAVVQTSGASQHVAQDAMQQMKALLDMSSAISQSATAVQEVSTNANIAKTLASSSESLAAEGKEVLARLGNEVEQIAIRQTNIDRITATITQIAYKTQVLSINAGIEAVGVGEQGRRFGVVAHEIGRLAEEVTTSARDVGVLISEAGQGIARAVVEVKQARNTVERIAEAASSASSSSFAIAASIAQQAASVHLLYEHSDQLQKISESTSVAMQEISIAMEDVATIAKRTQTAVARFVIN